MRTTRHQTLIAFFFILPALIAYISFWIYPFISVVHLSFHRWHLGLGSMRFVGIQQYLSLARDGDFWNALKNTILFMGSTVPLFVVISLLLAILINRSIRGISIFRTAYYIPVVTSLVAVSIIWVWLYDVDYGLLNFLLTRIGLPPSLWLSGTNTALPSLVTVYIWQRVGFYMVIYLAGLQNIPRPQYEAAEIDGAGRWAKFRYITLPSLSEVTFLLLVVAAIHSWRMFALVHVMTEGGPLGSTELILNYLYDRAFQAFQMGYSSSIAVVMFLFLLFFTILQWKIRKRTQ